VKTISRIKAVLVAAAFGFVIAHSVAQTLGTIKWQFPTASAARGCPAIGTNGLLYATASGNKLFALDLITGTNRWEKTLESPGEIVIGRDGTVYCSSYNSTLGSRLHALDGNSGTEKWAFAGSTPVVGADGTLYLVNRGSICAVDPVTGTSRWRWDLSDDDVIITSLAMAANHVLYFGTTGGKLVAFNASTRTQEWIYAVTNSLFSSSSVYSPAIGLDGTVYFGYYASEAGGLVALDGATGEQLWEFPAFGGATSSPALGPDGTVFFAVAGGNVLALHGATGELLWEYPAFDVSKTPAVAADGTVYASGDRALYALDGATGELRWQFQPNPGSWATFWPPNVGGDGTIFVASAGYLPALYALHGSSPLADSGWPKFQQNSQNTGYRHRTGTPEITRQPNGHWAAFGESTAFHFYSPVARPLSIQWRFNGQPIAGATNESLRLDHVQFANDGNYSVVLSNSFGTVTSDEAQLSVGYRLTVHAFGPGSVVRNPDLEIYPTNSVVELTAVPWTNRNFIGWSGDVVADTNPLTLTLHSNTQITAAFEWQLFDVKWQNTFSDGPALGSNGFLYAFAEGFITAIDTIDGRTVFKDHYFDSWWAPGALGADGTLYIGNYSGSSVWAHDGTTGEQKWAFNVGVCVHACPAIDADGTLYLAGAKLYAVDPVTRSEKWSFAASNIFESSPAIGTNGLVYAACYDGKMYALDALTGAKVWEFATGDLIHSSPALGLDGTVYFGSYDRKVYALNGNTGEKLWDFTTGDAVDSSPVIGSDGCVYIGSGDGNVYALDGHTGEVRWQFAAGAPVYGAGALAADGTLYIAGVALNTQTGEEVSRVGVGLGSPTIGPDGTIYSVGFAFYGTSPLASSPWPKFHYNLENTGRRAVTGPPVITRQPLHHWAAVDRFTSFNFYSPVSRPLAVQWRFNGADIPGGTNEILRLERVRLSDAGLYSVVISNQFGVATSSNALLSVGYDLMIFTEGLGTVQRHPDLAVYPTNSIVQLIAWPETPRAFVGWADDAAGDTNPHEITLHSNLIVTARFELLVGDKKWERSIGSYDVSMPAVGPDGTLYVGSDDGNVYAIDGLNGRTKWQFKTGSWVDASPVLGSDGTVYIGSTDSNLYALNGLTGAKKWQFFAGTWLYQTPAIGVDGTVYVAAGTNLYALDGATGAKKWEFTAADQGFRSPAIGPDGTIYLTSSQSIIHVLNGKTGRKKFEILIPEQITVTPAIGLDSTIYVGTWDNTVRAFNGLTGQSKWEFRAGSKIFSSAILGPDGVIYFGCDDRKVYALDAATGQQKWSFTASTVIGSSPAIGSDGTLYTTSVNSSLYALDAMTGAEKWQRSLGEHWGWRTSPTLAPDGTLYLGYKNGMLLAFKTPGGLATGLWPKLYAHADNRGRVHARPLLDAEHSRLTDAGFALVVHSETGELLRVQWSTNLQSWRVLGDFPNPTGTITVMDSPATNQMPRFYRIFSLAP
jgi:outer membrane protein assembly factor BamB